MYLWNVWDSTQGLFHRRILGSPHGYHWDINNDYTATPVHLHTAWSSRSIGRGSLRPPKSPFCIPAEQCSTPHCSCHNHMAGGTILSGHVMATVQSRCEHYRVSVESHYSQVEGTSPAKSTCAQTNGPWALEKTHPSVAQGIIRSAITPGGALLQVRGHLTKYWGLSSC